MENYNYIRGIEGMNITKIKVNLTGEDLLSIYSEFVSVEGLEVKDIKINDEISITDVWNINGIARTTFYRLFDTLDDVLLYQFDNLFEQSINKYKKDSDLGKSYAKMILKLAISNKTLITAIVKSRRYDIFLFSTRKKESQFIQNIEVEMNKHDLMYCTPILNQIAFVALEIWVENGCKESTEELYSILKRELKIISENM